MPGSRKPEPAVLEGDYRIPAALGSAAWAIALVVLLIMGDTLPTEDEWWIGVCLTGLALGLFALAYIPRWQRRQTATASPEATTAAAPAGAAAATEGDTDAVPPSERDTASTEAPTAESDPDADADAEHSQRAD